LAEGLAILAPGGSDVGDLYDDLLDDVPRPLTDADGTRPY